MSEVVQTSAACCLTEKREALVLASADRNGAPLRTVISTASGLVFTDPRPNTTQIETFYTHEYRQQYKHSLTPKKKHVLRAGRRALFRLEEFRNVLPQKARILDAGSGGGEFVYICNALGFRAHGVEPNLGYAEFSAKEYGIDVVCGFIHDLAHDFESFDCVTLFHVLEHLEAPVASLKSLARYLKAGGHFIVEVPNVNYTRTAPHQKWHIAHLYNFNAQTLAAVGAKAGLEPVRVKEAGDGGVLLAIFRKPAAAYQPDIDGLLAGSFDTTHRILTRHTLLTHYLNLHVPLIRAASKLNMIFSEKRLVKNYARSRDILDDLLSGKAA